MSTVEESLVGFKFKFGNEYHIRIANKIGEINRLKKSLLEKQSVALGIPTVSKKLQELEDETVKLIEYVKTL